MIEITGKQLRDYLEFTSRYYQVSPTPGEVAVNSYRAEGGGGFTMLAAAPVKWKSDISVKQMLEEELTRVDTLRIADIHTENWKLIY